MKIIPHLDGYYATEDGRIVSVRSGMKRYIKARLNCGYEMVTLSVMSGGRRQRHRFEVHRLVLIAHSGHPVSEDQEARHLNGVSTDNRKGNLAWGTRVQNAQDAVAHGTLGPGLSSRHRRLTDKQVADIVRRRRAGELSVNLAKEFDVHRSYIPKLVRGSAWSCLNL
ncbi:MAG TPA: HNH endonuclease [Pseudomonas sp.]|uniref:HNH endonuclease n=1 Tax=Pseudomonas sp. TaxID=306 RepID=UPI002ED89453